MKKLVLKDPSVEEFGDAFQVVKPIIHSEVKTIANGLTRACGTILEALGVEEKKLTKEQAFVMFDRFLFMSAILYAYAVKNPKEVSNGTDRK